MEKNNSTYITQVVLAILAYILAYPYGGQIAILAMVPLCLYMIAKLDAGYIPALAIHCMSGTSICYLILLSIVIVCLLNYNRIKDNREVKIVLLALIILLPLYAILTAQRMIYDNDTWQGAFQYTSYYLGFWCFPFGFLVAKTYNQYITKLIVVSLTMGFVLCNILQLASGNRGFAIIVFFGMLYGFSKLMSPNVLSGIMILLLSAFFFFRETMTFTELLTVVLGFVIIYCMHKGKKKLIVKLTGILPYVVIVGVMTFAIITYDTVDIGTHSDQMDFSSWGGFWSRAKFKLYDDRAIYWQAGALQVLQYHPILPMHDIPDIIAYRNNGEIIDDISFGAHNTPLQLLRVFGIFVGFVLIFCYIKASLLGAKYLCIKDMNCNLFRLLLITIFSNMIILFLTGTAAMLPVHSLLFFSILGVAYNKSQYENPSSSSI